MTDTETPMPTINSFYDNETSTEYAVEDTVARARAEAAQEAAEAAQEAAGAGIVTDPVWVQHRNTYRGQYLGDSYTDEQKAMVAAGTFDDLYIGDYWTINDVEWIIADINYWLGTGDIECTTPHLVVIPKTILYTTSMNDTNATNGGYVGSKLYAQNLNNAKSIIYSSFGENNILNHREQFTNAANNGVATGGIIVDSKVDLMSQIMVCGSMIFNPPSGGNTSPYSYTIDTTQLALFRIKPELIFVKESAYWLRDIISTLQFSVVVMSGIISGDGASHSSGVRPSFGVIG